MSCLQGRSSQACELRLLCIARSRGQAYEPASQISVDSGGAARDGDIACRDERGGCAASAFDSARQFHSQPHAIAEYRGAGAKHHGIVARHSGVTAGRDHPVRSNRANCSRRHPNWGSLLAHRRRDPLRGSLETRNRPR
jgi:hypothetical protein